jgi:hypothetical protein
VDPNTLIEPIAKMTDTGGDATATRLALAAAALLGGSSNEFRA